MATPVNIVSGFLGAGKTTAIRAQLAQRPDEQLAIIVNDFGEAGLDEATLQEDAPFALTNIPGGCICCTAPEGFVDALGAVLSQKPQRIIIEPTGLARPQDLIDTIRRCPHRDALALAPVIVLLDPARLANWNGEEKALGETQCAAADVLVANRTDLCSAEQLAHFETWAARLWPQPIAIHKTAQGRIPKELFDWPAGQGAAETQTAAAAEHVHGTDSSAGFAARSFVWPAAQIFSAPRLEAALGEAQRAAGKQALRAKGIFHTQEGVLLLELAGGKLHRRTSAHRRDSRMDFIFPKTMAAAVESAQAALHAAQLSAQELEAAQHQIEFALPNGRTEVVQRADLMALPEGVADVGAHFPKRAGAAARVSQLFRARNFPAQGRAVVCAWDGFASEEIPLSALREGLLVHTLQQAALPQKAGGPFRLLIPDGTAGAPASCANVKGVVRVVVKPAP